MNEPLTSDDIRRQMADLRSQMDDEVDQVIENAHTLGDWKFYVRKYPWWCLAGAAVVGYAVVPRRLELIAPDADALAELAERNRLVIKSRPDAHPAKATSNWKSTLMRTVMRTAISYAGRRLGEFLVDGLAGKQGDDGPNGSPLGD